MEATTGTISFVQAATRDGSGTEVDLERCELRGGQEEQSSHANSQTSTALDEEPKKERLL